MNEAADYWHKQSLYKDKEIALLKKDADKWEKCATNWCKTADKYLLHIQNCPACEKKRMEETKGIIGIAV